MGDYRKKYRGETSDKIVHNQKYAKTTSRYIKMESDMAKQVFVLRIKECYR